MIGSQGVRVPAEWERQQAVWLGWPHGADNWPDGLEEVELEFARFVAELTTGTDAPAARILVADDRMAASAMRWCAAASAAVDKLRFHIVPTNDCWLRDSGPIFTLGGVGSPSEPRCSCWRFNAWGEKFPYERDQHVAHAIAQLAGLPADPAPFVMEGGSLDSNGVGWFLTTRQCLLNPNRNGSVPAAALEQALAEHLGARAVIWLNRGLRNDHTDGHVDNLCRFVSPMVVMLAYTFDKSDPRHDDLHENMEILNAWRGPAGERLTILPIEPPWVADSAGEPLPASYLNFLITNDKVLTPTFDLGDTDELALRLLRQVFPSRQVVGVPARALLSGGGSLHCLSQQQPAAT